MQRLRIDIVRDQNRLQKQIEATFKSTTMSAKDRRITLEGFAIQKDKLDEELKVFEQNNQEASSVAIRDIEVEAETVLVHKSK